MLLWGDERPPWALGRWVVETTCILLASLAVACSFPTAAEKIFAVTGCTAVCLVCYCIPVYIHLVLRHRQKLASNGGPTVKLPYAHEAVQAAYCCSSQSSTPGRSSAPNPIVLVDQTWPAGDASGPSSTDSPPVLLVLPAAGAVQSLPPDASGSFLTGGTTDGSTLREPLLPYGGSTAGDQAGPGNTFDTAPMQAAGRATAARGSCRRCMDVVLDLALPVFIVAVGVGCSAAGLWVAACDIAQSLGG